MKEATKLQTETTSGSPMKLNDDIKAQLLEKHPLRRPPEVDTIHPRDQTAADKFHPIIFEEINAQCIQKTVLQMDGAAVPSGLDTVVWKRLCSSFGETLFVQLVPCNTAQAKTQAVNLQYMTSMKFWTTQPVRQSFRLMPQMHSTILTGKLQ